MCMRECDCEMSRYVLHLYLLLVLLAQIPTPSLAADTRALIASLFLAVVLI